MTTDKADEADRQAKCPVPGCEFEAWAFTDEQAQKLIRGHLREVHGQP
jgi:predicted small metal-binding protein